jgi:hypothetical protein
LDSGNGKSGDRGLSAIGHQDQPQLHPRPRHQPRADEEHHRAEGINADTAKHGQDVEKEAMTTLSAAFINLLKKEADKCNPGGPAMDHEPTRKFIMGEYPEQQTTEYQRLNFGPELP